eukprot:5843878-Prymnesium_polylepis.1
MVARGLWQRPHALLPTAFVVVARTVAHLPHERAVDEARRLREGGDSRVAVELHVFALGLQKLQHPVGHLRGSHA